MRRARPRALFLLTPLVALAGCAGGSIIEGDRLERLKEDLAAARVGAIRIEAIAPRALADGGPGAMIVMPFLQYGTQVTEFPLYDGYWKLAFTAVEEMRALGLDARLDTRVWAARLEAVAFAGKDVADRELDERLAELHAQEEVPALYRLDPRQKRELYVSKATLVAARSGLPPALRAKGKSTARQIRDIFFVADGAAAAPLELSLEAVELSVRADETTTGGGRTGRARLKCTLRARDGARLAEGEHACEAESEGASIARDKTGATWQVKLSGDDPLERAVRGALRAFLDQALPALRTAS